MLVVLVVCVVCFFFKQKTAYEMRISDWSSDVCSSDLIGSRPARSAVSLTIFALLATPWADTNGCNNTPSQCSLANSSDLGPIAVKMIGGGGPSFRRSEARRVGKECVSTCRSRWSPLHETKKNHKHFVSTYMIIN